MTQLIETLEAKKGNKFEETGECIATYGRYCLVFLPKGVTPGQRVRVQLQEIREDRRGNMMYRGQPAEVEYAERWTDNGEGNASKVTIATDWLLNESEVGVVETRALETKEVYKSNAVRRLPVLGQTLDSTFVEKTTSKVYHTMTEVVRNGSIVWEETGRREEVSSVEKLLPTKVTAKSTSWAWDTEKLYVKYSDDLRVRVRAYIDGFPDAQQDTTWGDLPTWLQDQTTADYPVCACGRSRRDVNVSDGYGKCEKCRAEEMCDRCGEQKKVTVMDGRLICAACTEHEKAEQLIAELLTADQLAAIAKEAELLSQVAPLEADLAEKVLATGLEFIEDEWTRKHKLDREKGYRWYYFTDDGVFATKLEKTAMQILQFLASTTGNPLVEMMSWFVEGIKPSERSAVFDYYLTTQVEGDSDMAPRVNRADLEIMVKKIEAGEPVLSDKLRGSEKDRKALRDWLRANASDRTYYDSYGRKDALVDDVERVSLLEKGYRAALQQIAEFEEWVIARQAQQEAGEIWMDVSVKISTKSRIYTKSWCITPDGELVEPREDLTDGRRSRVRAHVYGDIPQSYLVVSHSHDNYGYCKSESWTVHKLPANVTPQQRAKAHRLEANCHEYFSGEGTGWDLSREGYVGCTTVYSRDLVGKDREAYESMCEAMPINVTEYEVDTRDRFSPWEGENWETTSAEPSGQTLIVGPYKVRDPRQRKLEQLREELETQQSNVLGLEMAKDIEAEEYEQAELEAVERLEASYGTRPVSDGDIFEATFAKEEHRGETRVAAGPFWDAPSGTWVKLVGNPHYGPQVEAGVSYLVQVAARSNAQTHLFSYITDNPQGQHGPGGRKVRVYGYFAVPLLGPKDYDREIAETENVIRELESEISRLENEVKKRPVTFEASTLASVTTNAVVWTEEEEETGDVATTAMAAAFLRAVEQ